MVLFHAIGALIMASALVGCAGSSKCEPQPVALLNTAFPHSAAAIVPTTMNGRRVDMMVDTGAQYSSVTPAIATALNLPVAADKSVVFHGAGGSVFTSVATVDEFALGPSRGSKILLSVLGVNEHILPDGHRLGGLIGNDILRYYDVDLDLPAQQVFLVDTLSCDVIVPWSGALHPVSFDKAGDGAPEVPVTLDGHRFSAIIDTGAFGSISKYLFYHSGLAAEKPKLLATRVFSGIGDEKFKVKLYRFSQLTIGGVVWHHPVLAVGGRLAQFSDHIVIGYGFLDHHEMYMSNTTGQLFFR